MNEHSVIAVLSAQRNFSDAFDRFRGGFGNNCRRRGIVSHEYIRRVNSSPARHMTT